MKRVLVAAMMLLVTGSVFATDVNVEREKGKQEVKASGVKQEVNKENEKIKETDCAVTLSTSVGIPPFAGADISCTGTGANCAIAWDTVESCLAEGLRRGISKFNKFIDAIRAIW